MDAMPVGPSPHLSTGQGAGSSAAVTPSLSLCGGHTGPHILQAGGTYCLCLLPTQHVTGLHGVNETREVFQELYPLLTADSHREVQPT